jgi:hypothetical protein
MTDFQPGFHVCLNCGNPTKGKYNYQGVVLCSSCFSLAQMCDKRAVKQCLDLLTIYREALRNALVCGKLRPAKILRKDGDRVCPPTSEDLKHVLAGLAELVTNSK